MSAGGDSPVSVSSSMDILAPDGTRPDPRRGIPWREVSIAVTIFAVALAVFWYSPVLNVGDSKYTLLLTQNLVTKGSFVLDDYGIPRHPPIPYGVARLDGDIYQIEVVDDHLYYFFPPGSSILSTPFVLAQDALGKAVVRPDGTYNLSREERNQHFIAATLMAVLAAVFYLTARLFLPTGWSVLIAFGGALGTQIWSTASRGLWNHTWGVALIGCALALLAAHETGRRRLSPITLATVLSWAYFVRPTNSLCIVGFTVYLLLFCRPVFLRYAVTGAAWFALFVAYSWEHFGRLLPSYFAAARLGTSTLLEALEGNMISPSRGLLLFVPVVVFVVYLPVRYRRHLRHGRLLGLATAVSVAQYVAISGFVPWYGGSCFGPRYTTELVPWFVLTASLGLAAALRWRREQPRAQRLLGWRATLASGATLLALSVFINGRGANALEAAVWSQYPVSVDTQPARIWDWRYPQILAGWIAPPAPAVFPEAQIGREIMFGAERGQPYQFDGWQYSDRDHVWSTAHHATLIFAGDGYAPRLLRLRFQPYLVPTKLSRQRVEVSLNGRTLATLIADQPEPHDYTLPLPEGAWQARNFLTFGLRDAAAPAALESSRDLRQLGIALYSLEFDAGDPAPRSLPEPLTSGQSR